MATMRHQYHLARLLLEANVTVATRKENSTSSSSLHNSEANFDSNMVIILAALLCALVCALGLNSIVRCALRCTRGLAPETPTEIAARLASRGMKKDELRLIPEVVYKSGLKIPATDCPICLGEFREGEIVRILPRCNHGFHVKCIDTWLLLHSSCPTCRQLLFEHSSLCNAEV